MLHCKYEKTYFKALFKANEKGLLVIAVGLAISFLLPFDMHTLLLGTVYVIYVNGSLRTDVLANMQLSNVTLRSIWLMPIIQYNLLFSMGKN